MTRLFGTPRSSPTPPSSPAPKAARPAEVAADVAVRAVQDLAMVRYPGAGWCQSLRDLAGRDWAVAAAARDPSVQTPAYYRDGIEVHGYGATSKEQAAFQKPWMTVLWDLFGKDTHHSGFGQESLRAYGRELSPGARILNVGAGTGESSLDLLARYPDAAAIEGVDVSPFMVALARERFGREPRMTFHHRLGEDLRGDDGRFDLAYVGFVFHELPLRAVRGILAEAGRTLKPGGVLHVVDMNPASMRIRRQMEAPKLVRFRIEPYLPGYLKLDLPAAIRAARLEAGRPLFDPEVSVHTQHAQSSARTVVARRAEG